MSSGVTLSGSDSQSTAVPNLFIDEYMPEASGDAIKIYLYLLRCMSTQDSVQISYMAEKFDLTENKVKRALKHLEKGKLLQLEMDEAKKLLETAGYALSASSRFDLIIMYLIENCEYNIHFANIVLDDYGEGTLSR